MKKILMFALIILFTSSGCAPQKITDEVDKEINNNPEILEEMEEPMEDPMEELMEEGMMTEFNMETLAKYNGENNMPSYIAVDGVVYDVSGEKQWDPKHQDKYLPGKDYTEEIRLSPHGLSKLKGLPVVGSYKE